MLQFQKNKAPLFSRYCAEACIKRRGPFLRLSALTTTGCNTDETSLWRRAVGKTTILRARKLNRIERKSHRGEIAAQLTGECAALLHYSSSISTAK